MKNQTFYLARRDTGPVLLVSLKQPSGAAYDLEGCSARLLIELSDGTKIERSMAIVEPPSAGQVSYTWASTDWAEGALVVSPKLPLSPGVKQHTFVIETLKGDTERLTWPNASPRFILRIEDDIL